MKSDKGTEMHTKFEGFHRKTNDFLFELQFCNTVEKTNENLVRYKEYITVPMHLLYFDLLAAIDQFDINFETKPARCISSPYTDRRFSPTAPLKTYMYLRFRQANKTTDMLGLYFDMGSEAYGYGLKIYKPTAQGMEMLRERISKNSKAVSKHLDELADKGFAITGEPYKKDHYPDIKACSAKELLNRKSFSISKSKCVNESVYGKDLAVELSNAFLDLKEFAELLGCSGCIIEESLPHK